MSVSLRAIVTTVLLLLLPLVGALALHHVEIRSSSIVTTGPPDTSFGVELPNPVPADASPKLSTEAPTMPASPAALGHTQPRITAAFASSLRKCPRERTQTVFLHSIGYPDHVKILADVPPVADSALY